MSVMAYRTRDGLADYGFWIDFQPGVGWRVYIVFEPVRQDYDDSLKLPYQVIGDDGRRYVDWSEKIDNLGDAKTVAALWAEVVQDYRRNREQVALYAELIERYQCNKEGRKATSADPDRPSDDGPDSPGDSGGDAGAERPEHQNGGPVIPHPRVSAEPLRDLPERA